MVRCHIAGELATVRICGDFKVTLNSCLQVDQYPMPKIDDIFANLAGGQKFSKIDLRQGYLQLPTGLAQSLT
jgi:hypothetical protein